MRFLLEAALSNAVVASLLVLVVVLICRLPIRPAARHALWLIVLVKFVTPPLFPLVVPESQEWLTAWKTGDTVAPPDVPDRSIDRKRETPIDERHPQQLSLLSETPESEVDLPVDELGDGLVGTAPLLSMPEQVAALTAVPTPTVHEPPELVTEAGRSSPETPPVASTVAPSNPAFNFGDPLGLIWIGGSLAWFVFAGCRLRAFHRQVNRLLPGDRELQALADEVAAELGLKRLPVLRMTDAVVPPMLTLVPNRAVIILPSRLMSTLSREQQSAILAHELAHFRRGDQWMRWFEFVVVGLYWWHPAVWYARKELQAAEELCCDAWVVRMYPDQARGYAHALLAAVDFLAEVRAPAPAEACTLGPISSLKQRLDMILKRKQFPELTPAAKLALVALAFVILPWAPQLFGQAPVSPPATEAPVAGAPATAPTPAPTDRPGAQNLPGTGLPQAIPPAGAVPAPPPTAAPAVQELPLPVPLTPQPPIAATPSVAPAAPRTTAAPPGYPPGPNRVEWPVPATYATNQQSPTPTAAQDKSIEERLDRLEKMIEQFLTRAPVSQYGFGPGGTPVGIVAPASVPVARNVPALRGQYTPPTDQTLAATDRRIQQLEQELAALKRRKEALSNVDPNGTAVVVDTENKAIRGVNMSNGTTLWTFSIENPESVQSVGSNGQVVTVKTKDGQTFQLDSKTGRMILGTTPAAPPSPQPKDGIQKF